MRDLEIAVGFQDVDRSAAPDLFLLYLEQFSAQPQVREYKSRVLSYLGAGPEDRVLDVGCGLGDDVRNLAGAVGETGSAVGVDASLAMVEEARRRCANLPAAKIEQADGSKLPFESGWFDACRTDRTLQHVESPRSVLEEMARVTRSGGVVAASEPDYDTLAIDSDFPELTRRILAYYSDSVRHGTIGRRLPVLMASAGLTSLDIHAETLTFTDVALSDQILGVRAAAARAAEHGVIELEEAADWLASIQERVREGAFFCSVTGVAVRAVKP